MTKWLLIIVLLGRFTSVLAQQVPFYNHHFLNPFVYNPAMAGNDDKMNAFLVRNNRNNSFGGAINNFLTVDGGLINEKFGFGLTINDQKQGIIRQLGAGLSYSYKLKITNEQFFRFGIHTGFIDNQIISSAINAYHQNDPYLQITNNNRTVFNATAGIFYSYKQTKVGFAVPQLIGNKINYEGVDDRAFYHLSRHYMLNISHTFMTKINPDVSIIPNATLRYAVGPGIQYDFLTRLDHKKWGWVALGYKSEYAIELNFGIRIIDALQIGYSHEFVMGSLKNYQIGSNNEFMLSYSLGTHKKENSELAAMRVKNEELNQSNLSMEEQLRQKMESQNQLNKQSELELIQKNMELEDSLSRLNNTIKIIETQVQSLTTEINAIRKDLEQPVANDHDLEEEWKMGPSLEPEEEKITASIGYNFVELNGDKSPDGYYVVTGVFSKRPNADAHLKLCRNHGYSNAYLVVNKSNRFYYVIILFALEKTQAFESVRSYRAKFDNKTWILDYKSKN